MPFPAWPAKQTCSKLLAQDMSWFFEGLMNSYDFSCLDAMNPQLIPTCYLAPRLMLEDVFCPK